MFFLLVGKGSYGRVMLCKKKDENPSKLYAIKTLRKEALIKRGQLAHTSTERYILQNISNPFLTHLKFAFQTVDKLYMVLEYMPGMCPPIYLYMYISSPNTINFLCS